MSVMNEADAADELVWYAAYGSNMSAARLRCYLEGGCPPGGRKAQIGARNPSPPRAWRAVRLPFQLRFADRSAVWGGGKAFVATSSSLGRDRPCLARAWLLRREQFEDLASQESGRDSVRIRLLRLRRDGSLRIGTGPYDRVVDCGDLDGIPMVTLTHPSRPRRRSPSHPYLRILAEGLRETHGLTGPESAAYLASADGVTASTAELQRLLTPPCGPAA